MNTPVIIPGINIQFPWSQLIASGRKLVETRSYPIPSKHIGAWLAIIQTPGKNRRLNKAQVIGLVKFSGSLLYKTQEEWLGDFERHLVKANDPIFSYSRTIPKYGWEIENSLELIRPITAPSKRGIIFASRCVIPVEVLPEKFALSSLSP